jgi:hypothetical protein
MFWHTNRGATDAIGRAAARRGRRMGLAQAGETMEPDPPMFPIRDRLPVWLRLGRAWLCCWLVAVSACADGSGGGKDAGPGSDGGGCTPGCTGDAVRTCVPVEISTPCPLGCDQGASVCRVLVPSNGADRAQLEGVTADLRIPVGLDLVIDTTTGEIAENAAEDPAIVREAGEGVDATGIGFYDLGDGIAVLAVRSFTIEADAGLIGFGANALIILSEQDVTIEGQINFSAFSFDGDGKLSTLLPGPGGGIGAIAGQAEAEGCAPGTNGGGVAGTSDRTGGGGGGLGSDGAPGGVGGDGTEPGEGGDAQSADCPGSDLVPLRGGSGGAAGGVGVPAGDGGGGGGAIQVSSFTRIQLFGAPSTVIDGILVNGGGGGAGDSGNGGGGGGSGGSILLEAPQITVKSMILAANGGGGGGSDPGTAAFVGENGRAEDKPAAGGAGAREGGRGASLLSGSGIGGAGADGTGGGGGGVGIIRFNVSSGLCEIDGSFVDCLQVDSETISISPAFERGEPESR